MTHNTGRETVGKMSRSDAGKETRPKKSKDIYARADCKSWKWGARLKDLPLGIVIGRSVQGWGEKINGKHLPSHLRMT